MFKALNTEFIPGLSLKKIPESNCYKEAEFLSQSPVAGYSGYCKGFIDLMFEHQGKYYLLDWKSNWLGNNLEAYRRDALQQAMKQHHYYLQAKIYTDALRTYLRILDHRPFEDIFGGVFYVFLRGLPEGVLHMDEQL